MGDDIEHQNEEKPPQFSNSSDFIQLFDHKNYKCLLCGCMFTRCKKTLESHCLGGRHQKNLKKKGFDLEAMHLALERRVAKDPEEVAQGSGQPGDSGPLGAEGSKKILETSKEKDEEKPPQFSNSSNFIQLFDHKNYKCTLCGLMFPRAKKTLQYHCLGEKHQKNLKKKGFDPDEANAALGYKMNKKLYCDICQVYCFKEANFNEHIESKRHIMTLGDPDEVAALHTKRTVKKDMWQRKVAEKRRRYQEHRNRVEKKKYEEIENEDFRRGFLAAAEVGKILAAGGVRVVPQAGAVESPAVGGIVGSSSGQVHKSQEQTNPFQRGFVAAAETGKMISRGGAGVAPQLTSTTLATVSGIVGAGRGLPGTCHVPYEACGPSGGIMYPGSTSSSSKLFVKQKIDVKKKLWR